MRLYRHILRAHIGPFVFSLCTLMFIFLLQLIMKTIDQFVGKGLSAWVITELMALNLAWMVVLAVPMSVLVATLMAFGGMASNNEITAMKAGGMSLYKMIAPVALCSIILTFLMIEFNNNVLPDANHMVRTLTFDIRRKKPTLTIQQGLFSSDINGYSILARKTFEQSNDLEGVTIYDYTNPSIQVVVTGEHGRVSFSPDYRKLIMDLDNGEIHQMQIGEKDSYRRMRFVRHRIVMDVEGFDFERSGMGAIPRGGRELSARDMSLMVDSIEQVNTGTVQLMNTIVDEPLHPVPQPRGASMPIGYRHDPGMSPEFRALIRAKNLSGIVNSQLSVLNANDEQINTYLVEIYKKYSISVACIVFVFLGAPLGIMARRGTFGIAATLSLGFFVLYWACLIGGEKLADRGLVEPWIGMWIANIILGILGIYLLFRTATETPQISWTFFRRFVPKSWRTPEDQATP